MIYQEGMGGQFVHNGDKIFLYSTVLLCGASYNIMSCPISEAGATEMEYVWQSRLMSTLLDTAMVSMKE